VNEETQVLCTINIRIFAYKDGQLWEKSMAQTVIRVDERTHTTLRAWSDQECKPIGQIVTELVEREATQRFWREMHEGYVRLRANQPAWQDYLDERSLFEGGSLDAQSNEEQHDPTP
jgi:hypothetical protein